MLLRPSQPRRGLRGDALHPPRGDAVVTRASLSPASSGGTNAGGPNPLFRRSAFDVAVVGAGAPAAAAAAASARSGLRTVWLDCGRGPPSSSSSDALFHRRPSHAPARLACSDARLVALASEGLDAWRSLCERFPTGGGGGGGRRRRGRGSSGGGGAVVLSEGGSLDLASNSGGGGTDILEACAEASREAGVRGARLLAASEIEAALGGGGGGAGATTDGGAGGAGAGGGGGGSGLPLLSSSALSSAARSVSGLFLPLGGSLSFAAADEAAAADAAYAGVERWGPGFALAGWRDAGGGSRFELRGERKAATTAAGEEAAPLAEVERLVLVPPERGFEEFLARFGISLSKNSGAAKLVDVPWASAGGGTSPNSNSSPSFSQLTPCVLCHGLADRAADPGAPRGGAFERWLFVPSNGGGSFGGSVSVPAAFARGSLSASAVAEAALAAREAFLNSDDFDGEDEEAAEEEFLFSPFAEDAEAAAAAARAVLRPLSGSPAPRFAFASRTLVTPDGAPLCGWAPLEVFSEEDDEEEAIRGGGGGSSSSSSSRNSSRSSASSSEEGKKQQREQGKNARGRTKPRRLSFGALGSQSGRVLVLSPAAGTAAAGPSHGLLSAPVVARAAADLLSGFSSSSSSSSSSAVGGPLDAAALSPTRKAAGLRCVELDRDPWEGAVK